MKNNNGLLYDYNKVVSLTFRLYYANNRLVGALY